MENQKAKLQNWKKSGSKINGEKKESRKGKNMGKKWTCPFDVFCIYFAFLICFFLKLLFCICFAFFQAKSKIHAKKKQIEKTTAKNIKWTSHFVFPFLTFFHVFSLLFCFCVFWILLIWFLFFPFLFLHLSWVFSSLLILRISYGLVNIRLAISVQLLVLGMIKALTSTDATEERKRERGSGYAQRERERERWNDIDICPTWFGVWLTVTWGSQVCCTRHIASLHEDQTWPQAVEEIAQKCDLA